MEQKSYQKEKVYFVVGYKVVNGKITVISVPYEIESQGKCINLYDNRSFEMDGVNDYVLAYSAFSNQYKEYEFYNECNLKYFMDRPEEFNMPHRFKNLPGYNIKMIRGMNSWFMQKNKEAIKRDFTTTLGNEDYKYDNKRVYFVVGKEDNPLYCEVVPYYILNDNKVINLKYGIEYKSDIADDGVKTLIEAHKSVYAGNIVGLLTLDEEYESLLNRFEKTNKRYRQFFVRLHRGNSSLGEIKQVARGLTVTFEDIHKDLSNNRKGR